MIKKESKVNATNNDKDKGQNGKILAIVDKVLIVLIGKELLINMLS